MNQNVRNKVRKNRPDLQQRADSSSKSDDGARSVPTRLVIGFRMMQLSERGVYAQGRGEY